MKRMRDAVCLDDASLISAVLDADAGLDSADLRHLRQCAACAARAATWATTVRLASLDAGAAVPPAPADLHASILAAVRATPQDRPAVAAEAAAAPAWWSQVREWFARPAVWRPALAGGLALAIVAGVWTARTPHLQTPTSVVSPVSAPPAVASAPATLAPSAAFPTTGVSVALVSRRAAPRIALVASSESEASDWAAWDDSTTTQVGALAQSSLRTAVFGSGATDEGTDALSSDDPWQDVSDLTTQQKAWLAAELAKKMGG